MVFAAIAFIWITQPTFVTIVGILSTDIINGNCIPWGVHSSYAAEKTITSAIFFIALVLPLAIMVGSYSRIVYKLKYSVYAHVSSTAVPSVLLIL